MPIDALAEKRSRQELWSKGATSKKLQRSVSHEVERAIPLISASAPYATTLARQPCRNLAHMRAIWLKNPVDFLFSSRQLPSFSIEANVVFPSQLLAFSIWTPGAIRLFLIKRGETLSSETSRAYSRRNRVWRYNDIAHVTATTSGIALQQFLKIIGGKSPNSQNMRMFMRTVDDGRRDA